MNPSSIYDAALSQLHGNYQGLQDTLTSLAREQSKIFEKVARIQNDFESYKDSQNDRLDEILTNIDSDLKRVSQEARKSSMSYETRLSDLIKEPLKQVDLLKSEMRELKVEIEESRNKSDDNDLVIELNTKLEVTQNELTAFKAETKQKMENIAVDGDKIITNVESSCISKLEKYIGTDIVDEIVGTINGKLCQMKSDIQNELEVQQIKIEETSCRVGTLHTKVSDLENPRKSFDESDLMVSSMEVSRTPFGGKFYRTATRPVSPLPEVELEYTQYVNQEENNTPPGLEESKLNPSSVYDPVDVNEVTLYEDIALGDIEVKDEVGGEKKEMLDINSIQVCQETSSDNQTEDEFESRKTTFASRDMDETYSEIPTRQRRESLMSSLFINLASILDV